MQKRKVAQQPAAAASQAESLFPDWAEAVSAGYEVEKIVGIGSYGSVCRATHKPSGRKVAIKRMQNIFEDEVDCKRILREITLLRKIDHPNIVKVIEILEPKD